MKIYTVFGSTGEYSDHTEWGICSYLNELDAQLHVEAATQEEKVFQKEVKEKYNDSEWEAERAGLKNRYDPIAQHSYAGTIYYIETTELIEKFSDYGKELSK